MSAAHHARTTPPSRTLIIIVIILKKQFSHFWWPSAFGIAPVLALYCWVGTLAADLSDALSGGDAHHKHGGGGKDVKGACWVCVWTRR